MSAQRLSASLILSQGDVGLLAAVRCVLNAFQAIAEAVQRPTMKFVATKTAEQLDLQALHRVRERLVSQRTRIINQIRAFLLERAVAVRQGLRFLRAELPRILATPCDALSPRMLRIIIAASEE
jgi:transposase